MMLSLWVIVIHRQVWQDTVYQSDLQEFLGNPLVPPYWWKRDHLSDSLLPESILFLSLALRRECYVLGQDSLMCSWQEFGVAKISECKGSIQAGESHSKPVPQTRTLLALWFIPWPSWCTIHRPEAEGIGLCQDVCNLDEMGLPSYTFTPGTKSPGASSLYCLSGRDNVPVITEAVGQRSGKSNFTRSLCTKSHLDG